MSTSPMSRAILWARFNVVRHLRKPGTLGWILGVAAIAGIIRVAGGSTTAIANLVVLYAVPLAGLSFGTSAMREEIEDQTLTYVFTRSVDRAWIYVARVLAAVTVAALVGIAGSLLATNSVTGGLRTVMAAVGSAAAYTAFFALCGVLFKRAASVGIVFAIAWEYGLGAVPGFLSQLTLRTHLRSLADLRPTNTLLATLWEPPSIWISVLVVLGVAAVTTFVAAMLVRRREFVITR